MKYLGIDYGAKRVGVAVSNDTGSIAFPRKEFMNDPNLLSSLLALAQEEKIECIVVGDTRTLSGNPNSVTEEAERFMKALGERSALPVIQASEAESSKEASRYAPQDHEHDNAAAAAFILQRYLDMHEGEGRIGS